MDLKLDSKIININNLDDVENVVPDKGPNEKKNYSRMKVNELRSLVVQKDLTDNDKAQQMKKTELVKIITIKINIKNI